MPPKPASTHATGWDDPEIVVVPGNRPSTPLVGTVPPHSHPHPASPKKVAPADLPGIRAVDPADGPTVSDAACEKIQKTSMDPNYAIECMELPGKVVRESLFGEHNLRIDFSKAGTPSAMPGPPAARAEFLLRWANALLRKDAAFTMAGKLYSTAKKSGCPNVLPGQAFPLADVAKCFVRQDFTIDPKLPAAHRDARALAYVNGKKSYIYGGKLYRTAQDLASKRTALTPSTVVDDETAARDPKATYRLAFGRPLPKKVPDWDPAYVVARTNAKLNSDPVFSIDGTTYRTETGKRIDSGTEAKFEASGRAKVTWNERVDLQDQVNGLSTSSERLAAYQRLFPNASKCDRFAVYDSVRHEISIRGRSDDRPLDTFPASALRKTGWERSADVPANTFGAYTWGHSGSAPKTGALYVKPEDAKRAAAFPKGCPYYVLPATDDGEFRVKDGHVLAFQKDGTAPIGPGVIPDAKEVFAQPSGCYHRLLRVDTSRDPKVPANVATPFMDELRASKGQIMRIAAEKTGINLTDDDYNELLQIAYGIIRNEAFMSGKGNFLYWAKETNGGQLFVSIAKKFREIFRGVPDSDNSRGLGQMKESFYPRWLIDEPPFSAYGIGPDTLSDPKNAAVAIMGYLVGSLKTLKNKEVTAYITDPAHPEKKSPVLRNRITAANRKEFLLYLYSAGGNAFNALPVEGANGTTRYEPRTPRTPAENQYIRNIETVKDLIIIQPELAGRDVRTDRTGGKCP